MLTKAHEMARNIANLKGKKLEEYVTKAEAVIEFVNVQLEAGNLNDQELQALQETKKALEEVLEIIASNRSN